MQTINERISILINTLKITKTAFAESLKVSQQYISKLVREGNPSDLLIEGICQKYNVNEKWLRTGEGEMFIVPEDEIAEQVSHLLEESNPFYDLILSIMKSYDQLNDSGQKMIHDLSQNIIDNLKKKED